MPEGKTAVRPFRYQSSFTADTGTYRLCADKVVCKRVYEVKGVLLDNGKEKRSM